MSEAQPDKPVAFSGNEQSDGKVSVPLSKTGPSAPKYSSPAGQRTPANADSPKPKHDEVAVSPNAPLVPASGTDLPDPASISQAITSLPGTLEPPPPPADPAQSQKDAASGKVHGSDSVGVLNEVKNSAPMGGALALAVRVSSGKSDSSNDGSQSKDTSPVEAVSRVAAPPAKNQVSTASLSETGTRHEAEPSPALAAPHSAASSLANDSPKPSPTDASSAAHPADFETELLKFRSEPVRGAYVQISGADNQRVDIRLVERSGAMSVTVRSADAGLTRMLQERAPELNNNLVMQHFKTELWTPPAQKSSEPRSSDGNGASHQQHSQQSGERNNDRRQNGKQQNEPEWVAELEKHPTAFQKRIEYTWHQ